MVDHKPEVSSEKYIKPTLSWKEERRAIKEEKERNFWKRWFEIR